MTTDRKIELHDVTVAFDDFVAVKDVTLEIHTHELLCIVGTSGGGKTTLLRALGGLVPVECGSILLDGEQIDRPTPRIGIIFQHFGLFPWKTVRANIEYGLRVSRRGRGPEPGIVDRLLALMHLTESAANYPYQLSGGMQQRVGIARALAVQPEVLLMDEPFGALDALTRETLQTELLQLWQRQREMTAVLVTHDIDEAILLGDRIAVLTGRPGGITEAFEVPIERPRVPQEIRFHEAYAPLRRKIWETLQRDQQEFSDSHDQQDGNDAPAQAMSGAKR